MVYKLKQHVGKFTAGAEVTESDFPAGMDFDRLIRNGAIESVDGQAPKVYSGDAAAYESKISGLNAQVATLKGELLAAGEKLNASEEGRLGLAVSFVPAGEEDAAKLSAAQVAVLASALEIDVPAGGSPKAIFDAFNAKVRPKVLPLADPDPSPAPGAPDPKTKKDATS